MYLQTHTRITFRLKTHPKVSGMAAILILTWWVMDQHMYFMHVKGYVKHNPVFMRDLHNVPIVIQFFPNQFPRKLSYTEKKHYSRCFPPSLKLCSAPYIGNVGCTYSTPYGLKPLRNPDLQLLKHPR